MVDIKDTGNSFAAIFAHAVSESPYSLSELARMLHKKGYKVSQATLSHWSSGRSLPRHKKSHSIIKALEDILTVPSGLLTNAITGVSTHSLAAQTTVDTPPQLVPRLPERQEFEPINDVSTLPIDWEREAQREIFEERIVYSADMRTSVETTTVLVRVPTEHHRSIHIGSAWVGDDAETKMTPSIYNLEGATIGHTYVIRKNNLKVTQLLLPTTLIPGSLHRLSYTLSFTHDNSETITSTPRRLFAWPLRVYTCVVSFQGAMPHDTEWLQGTYDIDTNAKTTTATPVIPQGTCIQITLENINKVDGQFHWQW